jgi:multiple sugar transport system ATP-binding protein
MVRLASGALVDPGVPLAAPAANLGLRPEHLTLTAPDVGLMAGRVAEIEYLGSDLSLFVDAGPEGRINVRVPGQVRVTPGETVGLGFSPAFAHLFDAQGQRVGP